MSPHNAEVADIAAAKFGEDAVEDVTQHVHAKPSDDSLTTARVVIGHPAEPEGNRDLQEQTNRGESVRRQRSETKTADDSRSVGVKGTLRAVVAKCDQEVDPHPPSGEEFLESCEANALLLPPLHGVIHEHTSIENVQLSVAKDPDVRQESASWLLERIGKTEAENEATETGEAAHQDKKPEPTVNLLA